MDISRKRSPEATSRHRPRSLPEHASTAPKAIPTASATPPTKETSSSTLWFRSNSALPFPAVALVESEKTAIICTGLMPNYLWLATGGKSQFNERLKVLYGRDVVAFPDVDGYTTWCEKVKEFPDLNISISNLLQCNATPEDMENHIDIADWLIRWKLQPETFETEKRNITFEKVKPFISEEYQDEVLALIEDLDLIIF